MIRTHGVTHFSPKSCFGCKVLTVEIAPTPAFQPHYNHSVGAYVNNQREYEDKLKYHADYNSEATGITHTYEPRLPGDVPLPYPDADSGQAWEDRTKLIKDMDRLVNPLE